MIFCSWVTRDLRSAKGRVAFEATIDYARGDNLNVTPRIRVAKEGQ
jgi:hypothetical protein